MNIDDMVERRVIHEFHLPVMGINPVFEENDFVAAAYNDPGFWVFSCVITQGEKGLEYGLQPKGSISAELSSIARGGKYRNLWPDDLVAMPPERTQRRAQAAQFFDNSIYFLQNAGREIGVLDLNTDHVTFLDGLEERCEYFRVMPNAEILTIENFEDCKLGVYQRSGDELRQVKKVSLNDFPAMRDSKNDRNEPVRFIYGLAELNDELLFVTDFRSNVRHGLFALEMTSEKGSLADAIAGVDSMRVVNASGGLYGNGIAVRDDGLLVSQYFTESRYEGISGASRLLHVPL